MLLSRAATRQKPLSYFRRIYETKNVTVATRLLSRRCRVDYDDPESTTPSDSVDVQWKVERHFIDMMVCVAKDIGFGAVLPNQNVNSLYSIQLDFSKHGKCFRTKKVKLGFNPSGRMLWIGKIPSRDDIWIAWKPKNDDKDEAEKWDSSCLSKRHYRIMFMLFAYLLKKAGYRDIVVHDCYPDLFDNEAFMGATNLQ
jgi:hypothetical protein